jgi:hypothetical protein
MPNKLQTVNVKFSAEVETAIEHHIEDHLRWLKQAHRELHTDRLPKWRRIYLGTPAEMTRNFPFPNAANTVVQVVGETVDTMVARVMGLIYATHPLWPFQNFVKSEDTETRKKLEQRRQVIENFMDIVGIEPDELNLQFVEALWFTDAAKLGTAFVKIALEHVEEAVVVGYDESGKRIRGRDETVRFGPRVCKLRHEDVLADPTAQTLEDSDFVAVRHPLKRVALEDRAHRDIYDRQAVEKILSSPDRPNPSEGQREELTDQGIATGGYPDVTAEWDIYECYFPWWNGGHKYRLVYSYHERTRTVLRKIFNFLPKNELPIKRAKLGYRTDGMYGHGYSELLENYQEELSTTHNQRLDNATVANVRALRVSPRARALDANMELFPTAVLVGDKDEIEPLQVGDVYPSTFKNEEMTLGLVARRAGITPAISGAGTGGVMKRPNVYSSQGTLAVMQENNSVVGFATAEFRHAHIMLGSALTAIYGRIGTGGKEQMFGLDAPLLQEAFQEFERNRLRIPIRAATGSLNREVDKQTGLLIAGLMERFYTAISQVMQAIGNPIVPPEVKQYLIKRVVASEQLHRKVLKDFGYDQPDLYVPEAPVPKEGGAAGGASQQPSLGGGNAPAAGGGGDRVPFGNVEGYLSGLAPFAGGSPR